MLHYLALYSFDAPSPPVLYTLSLHDALPISSRAARGEQAQSKCGSRGHAPRSCGPRRTRDSEVERTTNRSEEHTSELQSRFDLVCRLLLEKKKQQSQPRTTTT